MNPLDPELFVTGTPHALLHELRRRAPVARFETHDGPCVLVLDHANALRVLRDPATFSSARGVGVAKREGGEGAPIFRALQLSDPPLHGKLRRLVAPAFESWDTTAIRARAAALLDGLADERPDDVTERLVRLPLELSCELVGIDDVARAGACARRVVFDIDRAAAERELRELLEETIAERRRRPREDLASRLLEARVDGERFGSEDTVWLLRLLVLAGHRSTGAALAAGLLALATNPAEKARLDADASLVSSATTELLRFTSPLVRFGRECVRDVTLAGVDVHHGERVVVVFPAANRDPAVFPEPDRFDVSRDARDHVAFGTGPHLCVGADLARAVIRAVLEAVRGRPLELVGPVEWWRSSFLAAPSRLPLRVGRATTPRRRAPP